MRKLNDLTGQRFGRFVVIKRGENEYAGKDRQQKTTWICQCDCGNIKTVWAERLKRGAVTNCGCWHEEKRRERESLQVEKYKEKPQCTIHDKRLHNIWIGIKERCYTESSDGYKQYGERGIDMCDEWRKRGGFWAFRDWALANGYREDLTIDRIDNNKGYYPDNCRWATYKEQANNTRTVIKINVDGEVHTISEWADILGVSKSRLYCLYVSPNGPKRVVAYIRYAANPTFSFVNYKKLPNNLEEFTEEEFLEKQNRRKADRKEYFTWYNKNRRKRPTASVQNGDDCEA